MFSCYLQSLTARKVLTLMSPCRNDAIWCTLMSCKSCNSTADNNKIAAPINSTSYDLKQLYDVHRNSINFSQTCQGIKLSIFILITDVIIAASSCINKSVDGNVNELAGYHDSHLLWVVLTSFC